MIALLLAAADTATAPADVVRRDFSVHRTLPIPNEIGPAIVPYASCLINGLNAESRKAGAISDSTMQAIATKVKLDCASIRGEAKSQGIALLDAGAIGSPEQREKEVEDSLSACDEFFFQMPSPSPSPSPAPSD